MPTALKTTTVRFKEYNAVVYESSNDWGSYNTERIFKGYKGDIDVSQVNVFSPNNFEIQQDIYAGDSNYLPKDIKDKWIYVFRTTHYENGDGTNILVNTIHMTDPEKTYQLPIFENYRGIEKIVFSFFCLSQIELSSARLDRLREQLDTYLNSLDSYAARIGKCPRLTFIPLDEEQFMFIDGSRYTCLYNGQEPNENVMHSGEGDNKITTVFLTDYLDIADGMSKTYQLNKILFQDEMKRPTTLIRKEYSLNYSYAEFSTITELTYNLCNSEGYERRHKKHVAYEELLSWREDLSNQVKPMIDLYSQSAAMFLPWIKQESFHAMLFDYSIEGDDTSDQIEEKLGDMFELLYEEIQGRNFFREILEGSLSQLEAFNEENNNDKSKISAESISKRFNETNWFTVCFYASRKGPDGFSKILSAFSTVLSMQQSRKAIDDITRIIDHRFTNNLVSITNAKLAAYHNRYASIAVWQEAMQKRYPGCTFFNVRENGVLVKYAGYESIEVDQNKLASYLKSGQNGITPFLTALSIFNLGMSIYAITRTTNTKDALIKTLVAGGALTNLIMKFIGTSSKVTLSKIGIITALIDAVNSENSRHKALSMDDHDLAIAQGVVTAGNIVAATGCAVTLVAYIEAGTIGGGALGAGAGGIGAVPGAAAGALIGLIGGLIVIGGTVIAGYVTDTQYESWLEHSMWGDSFCESTEKPAWAVESFEKWAHDLSYQTRSFYNIQYDFSMDLSYANNGWNLRNDKSILKLLIEPNAIQEISRMYVTIIISNGSDSITIVNNMEILEQQYGTVIMENSPDEKIFLRWCESKSYYDINLYLEKEIKRYMEEYFVTMSTMDIRTIINKIKNDLLMYNDLNNKIKVLSFSRQQEIHDVLTFYTHVKLDVFGDNSIVIDKRMRPKHTISLTEQDIMNLGKRLINS